MLKEQQERKIIEKIKEIDLVARQLPSVVIIHDLPSFEVRYISPLGLRLLNLDTSVIQKMANQEYHEKFFNTEDANHYIPIITELIKKNTEEEINFFQQVKTSQSGEYDWYMSAIKILLRNDDDTPLLTITTATKVDPKHHISSKVSRLLEENNFLRQHYEIFSKLTGRERQVLTFLALGKTATEISNELHISVATAETHRKNIKRKLNVNTSYELSLFARAFDLI